MMCIGQLQSAYHIVSVNSEIPSFSFSDGREMGKGFTLYHDMTEKQKDENRIPHFIVVCS